MYAFVYQAALVCENCGETIRETIAREHPELVPANREDESLYDSDRYPKGPYADGGGESDCPNHCDKCGVFLENPLTSDGMQYVRERLTERPSEVSRAWAEFYGITAPKQNLRISSLSDVIYREDLSEETIRDCTHSGSCDEEVAHWVKTLNFTVDRETAIQGLKRYGAWTLDELQAMEDERLAGIVLWSMCGDFKEGSELFTLGG